MWILLVSSVRFVMTGVLVVKRLGGVLGVVVRWVIDLKGVVLDVFSVEVKVDVINAKMMLKFARNALMGVWI